MPGIDARFKAAARRSDQPLSLSLKSTDQRLVSTDQLRLPTRRTKLLTPSVVICRCSRSHELQRPRRNLPEANIRVKAFFRIFEIKFLQFLENFLSLQTLRAPLHGT